MEEKGKLKFKTISNTNAPTAKGNYLKNIENCTSIQFKYAMIMDREVESIHNLELYNFINEWWAIRYRYGGSDQNGSRKNFCVDHDHETGKVRGLLCHNCNVSVGLMKENPEQSSALWEQYCPWSDTNGGLLEWWAKNDNSAFRPSKTVR